MLHFFALHYEKSETIYIYMIHYNINSFLLIIAKLLHKIKRILHKIL